MTEWDRTKMAYERLEDKLDADGKYQGRHIIGRDTPIDGGVSLGGSSREAIVVDSKQYPKIRELYQLAKTKASENGRVNRSKVLRAVYDTVTEALPTQDNGEVENLVKKLDVRDDKKISLDVFIERGVGVCMHSALTAGVLLELFKNDGYIGGNISVDRNNTSLGAHAWARYTTSDGTAMILDVTQKYFGTLDNAASQGRWPYERPTGSVKKAKSLVNKIFSFLNRTSEQRNEPSHHHVSEQHNYR